MRKGLVFIVMLLCLATYGFSGGGSEKKKDNYPINISVYTDGAYQNTDAGIYMSPITGTPNSNNKMYRYIQNNLNVTFSWKNQINEGGIYADILQMNNNNAYLIDQGALIPLEGLIEQYGPNIKKHYANVWENMKSPDGHIYTLINFGVTNGALQDPFYNGSAFWTQKAILKDAGYPQIKTIEEWFNLIENYYRRNPTINGQPTIPFTVVTYDWRAFELWNPPNFLMGNPNEGNGTVNPQTFEYKVFFTSDGAKRWYRLLNEMDKKGLIDRNAFTDNHDQYLEKIASGRVLGLFGQQWQFDTAEDLKTLRNEHIRTMAPLPIVFDSYITPKYRTDDITNYGHGLGISINAKDPVRIIRFLNDYLDEEVQRTIHWGIEGQDWQRDSGGVPYRTERQRANWNNQSWQDQNRALLWLYLAPNKQGSFSDGYPINLQDYFREREPMILPEDKELFAAYNVTGYAQMMSKEPQRNTVWYPTWSLPHPPNGSLAQMALQRTDNTMRRMYPQIILAPTSQFDALWNEFVREVTVTNNIAAYEQYMTEQIRQRVRERGGR